MGHLRGIARGMVAMMAPMLLSGCFLTPGKFTANVDVRKDGSFSVAYKGEVIFSSPDSSMGASKPTPWHDGMAACPVDGDPYVDEWAAPATDANDTDAPSTVDGNDIKADSKPCTAKQIAGLRETYEAELKAKEAKRAEDSRQFAALFGFGGDDAGHRKFAERLMKEKGWKSVTYRGNGVFDVDYALSGRIGHDYIFPVMPNQEFIMPFILLRTRADGSVTVSAPAMTGGAYRAKAMQRAMPGGGAGGGPGGMPGDERMDGTFTVTTDGEILTNNTLDGPERTTVGRTLTWKVGPESDRIPEALISLR